MKYTWQRTPSGAAVQSQKLGHPARARLPAAAQCDAIFAGRAGANSDHESAKGRKHEDARRKAARSTLSGGGAQQQQGLATQRGLFRAFVIQP
jgi:hypothetical protein